MHRRNLCALRADAYAESQPISVTAGKTYRFQTWVKQQLGGGTAVHRLAFYNSGGLVKRVNLSGSARQLPTAWSTSSGWEKFSGLVAAPPGSSYVRLEVVASYIDGYVYFDDVTLEEFVPEATITRSAYGLAGQLIATRVTTSPSDPDDGLYYFLADHLGSVSGMTNDSGNLVGDIIRFEPFGEYRPGSGPNDITDRGFTGHRHNDELGLVYMNARYYLGAIGRFVSADTIIPDPANPQSHNRYSYVLNSPVKFIDPSGHCGADVEAGTELYNNCVELRKNLMETYNISITGSWMFAEMLVLQLVLGDIEAELGSEGFAAYYSGTEWYREGNSIDQTFGGITYEVLAYVDPENPETIVIGNHNFEYGEDVARYSLLHESAHIIDIKLGFTLSRAHVNGTSSLLTNSDCIGNPVVACNYSSNLPFSRYSGRPEEDFAETWAAGLFRGNWSNLVVADPNIVVSPYWYSPSSLPQPRVEWIEFWLEYLRLNALYS